MTGDQNNSNNDHIQTQVLKNVKKESSDLFFSWVIQSILVKDSSFITLKIFQSCKNFCVEPCKLSLMQMYRTKKVKKERCFFQNFY